MMGVIIILVLLMILVLKITIKNTHNTILMQGALMQDARCKGQLRCRKSAKKFLRRCSLNRVILVTGSSPMVEIPLITLAPPRAVGVQYSKLN